MSKVFLFAFTVVIFVLGDAVGVDGLAKIGNDIVKLF
tara:strand:+ start:2192 stop:2302 length:111 start_codon:yes stop_codon:yes gene_type:complete